MLLKRHWVTTDGHHFVSVAASVPTSWKRVRREDGKLAYLNGSYAIVRTLYGTSWMYDVFRDGVRLPLAFTRQLRAAKARAVKNAEGLDEMHVA
jgi:hypothetical protein